MSTYTVIKIPISYSSVNEPKATQKKIGSTTYEATIRFSETSKETLEDKIFRMIE
jgi:hypothetical protein